MSLEPAGLCGRVVIGEGDPAPSRSGRTGVSSVVQADGRLDHQAGAEVLADLTDDDAPGRVVDDDDLVADRLPRERFQAPESAWGRSRVGTTTEIRGSSVR